MTGTAHLCGHHIMHGRQPGRCRNRAWWPGGRCHLHRNPAWTFVDYLTGIASGCRSYGAVPSSIRAAVLTEFRYGYTGPWWDTRSTPMLDPSCAPIDSPKVVITVGFGVWKAGCADKHRVCIAVAPDDARVSLDRCLVDGLLGSEAERLSEDVLAAAWECEVLAEAIAQRVTTDAIIARRRQQGDPMAEQYGGACTR